MYVIVRRTPYGTAGSVQSRQVKTGMLFSEEQKGGRDRSKKRMTCPDALVVAWYRWMTVPSTIAAGGRILERPPRSQHAMKALFRIPVPLALLGLVTLALLHALGAQPQETHREVVLAGVAAPTTDLDAGTAEPEHTVSRAALKPFPPEVVAPVQELVHTATVDATDYARLDRGRRALEEASSLLRRHPRRAERLARRVLETPQPDLRRNQALWIVGEAEAAAGNIEEALAAFDQIAGTPVDDYLELRRIELLLEDGASEEAADRAQVLIEKVAGTPSQIIHHAREIRIQALYAAYRWQELIDECSEFLEIYAEYPRQDLFWLWLGQAELALGNTETAASSFDRVVWDYPYRPVSHIAASELESLGAAGIELPSHSLNDRFERARRLRIIKHWAIVDELLAKLLQDVEGIRSQAAFANEIRFERVRNSYGSGDFESALAHLEEIEANGSSGVRYHTLMTWYADTYARLGRIEDGVEALRRRDRRRGTVRRHQELAEYYYENGYFDEALEHYEEVRGPRRRDDWDHTLLLFITGHYQTAAIQFEYLADHSTGSTRRRNRYWQARSLQEAGELDEASRWFEEIHATWPRRYYGLQAQNRLEEIRRSEPTPILAAGEADQEVTAHEYTPLQEVADDLMRNLDLGLTQLVRSQLPELPEATVVDGGFSAPARIHWDGPDGVADTFLAFTASGHTVTTAYTSPVDMVVLEALAESYGDVFPTLERAYFLHSVGQWREAWEESREASLEFRELDSAFGRRRRPTVARPIEISRDRYAHFIDRRPHDTGFWGLDLGYPRWPVPEDDNEARAFAERQITIYEQRADLREAFTDGLMALGDYNFVRRFTLARNDWDRGEPGGEGRDLWSQVYPRAFPELVTDYAAEWELNPYIVWSLMKIESSYNPDSISTANARGLLQVIPKTGELVSQRLGYWDFGPHNLMNPELSIEFGCYYFSELMTKFRGQELLAFAGYNGGPHNVARWLEGWGEQPLDVFVELIPFDQARRYSKAVFRQLALYRMIYLGEDSLYLGQTIDPVYEHNIHF